jgi:hypothetical protein
LLLTDLNTTPAPDGGAPNPGTDGPFDYCVSGNTLVLNMSNSSEALMLLTFARE